MPKNGLSYEELLRIVELCKAVQKQGFDPFHVDVKGSLETLRRYLPNWSLLEELLLDAEAIGQIASIIRLQSEWIRKKATLLDVDPLLVELKVRIASSEDLASFFIDSWHPILNLQNLSPGKLSEAIDYWNQLTPLYDRMKKLPAVPRLQPGSLSLQEIIGLQLMTEEEFNTLLLGLWRELLSKAGKEGKVEYWDFISRESYEETIRRAYLTSFLVSERYAAVEARPLQDEIYLIPNEDRIPPPKGVLPKSLAIPLEMSKWKKVVEE